MKINLRNIKESHFVLIALAGLFFQNLLIFWNHYFLGYIFRLDFARAYYAKTAFITTAIDLGHFPTWVPFQNMGFPLIVNIQNGLYYPFFLIFPLFDIQYTLNASAIFHILHIFAGSVGLFLFLNLVFKSSRYAFVGAVAFQFFGGFFSATGFPDILRAFALAPWLFYFFTFSNNNNPWSKRMFLIPIGIFLMFTGIYPGSIISGLFIFGIYSVLQTFNRNFSDLKFIHLKTLAIIFGLMILGIGLSMIHLGPWLDNLDQIYRLDHIDELIRQQLSFAALPSLFMPSNFITEVGFGWQISLYVTLPILILACFVPFSLIKKYWIYGVVLTLGFLMAAGSNSFLWQLLGSLIPPLTFSRLPISDYKIFIAIPMIIFALLGLKTIVERKINMRYFSFRSIFVISWFILSISFLYYFPTLSVVSEKILDFQVILSIIVLSTTLIIVFAYLRRNLKKIWRNHEELKISIVFLIIIVAIISFDGSRVIFGLQHIWQGDPNNPEHSQYKKYDFPLEKNGKLVTYSIFEQFPKERPAREEAEDNKVLSYVGYLDGSYMMENYGTGDRLKNRLTIVNNDNYKEYMLMKWTPILLDSDKTNLEKIELSENIFKNINLKTDDYINQTYYGLNDIHYSVSLDEPKLMIENEMYFSGWNARLEYEDKQLNLESVAINDLFRGWKLPAGDYEMKAYYEIPNIVFYQSISLISLVIWIIIVIVFWRKTKPTLKT